MPDGEDAIKALPWEHVRQIVNRFKSLNPYDPNIVPGSILHIVEELNFHNGDQRQLYGCGISAKRYGLYSLSDSGFKLIKISSTVWDFTTGQRRDATLNAGYDSG